MHGHFLSLLAIAKHFITGSYLLFFLFFLCKNWFTSLLHFSLPYTTAAIYEVQRVADLVPFAVPHETTEAASVSGYHIPKGQENEVLNF